MLPVRVLVLCVHVRAWRCTIVGKAGAVAAVAPAVDHQVEAVAEEDAAVAGSRLCDVCLTQA